MKSSALHVLLELHCIVVAKGCTNNGDVTCLKPLFRLVPQCSLSENNGGLLYFVINLLIYNFDF